VESKIVALRLNSDIIRWEERGNRVVKDKVPMAPGKKWVGLIQLFSAETGEPLAMFPDGVIQRMRVAVTSALASREMARQGAAVMAIFGSGWQAGAHVPPSAPFTRLNASGHSARPAAIARGSLKKWSSSSACPFSL
jgi:hypothetical protein